MSWEEITKAIGGAVKPLAELPNEFTGTVQDIQVRNDRRGTPALFITIELEDGSIVVQKFTKMSVGELVSAFEKLKVASPKAAKGKTFKWKQKAFARGNPRWIPVEVV